MRPGSWGAFAAAEPQMAAAGERLYRQFTVGYLATLRRDGGPRLHPVTVTLAEGGLFVATIGRSHKAADLRRDPRFALHAFPQPWTADGWSDEEFVVNGRASEVRDPERRAAVSAVHNDAVAADDPLWELDVLGAYHKHRADGRLHEDSWHV